MPPPEANMRGPAMTTNRPIAALTDIERYRKGLRHSLADKMFFVERVPAEVTVFAEFGCATGDVLREVHLHRREWPQGWGHHYIGYDHHVGMIELAKHQRSIGNFEFTSDYSMFAARLARHHRKGLKSCLILSSVVHEVLSQDPGSFMSFWKLVGSLGCEFIAIRDMGVEASAYHAGSVDDADVRRALMSPAAEPLRLWVIHSAMSPGGFSSRAEFLEALLKCEHHGSPNWEHALEETFLTLSAEQWLNYTTIGTGYKLRHFEHTPLLALQNKWRDRYDGLYVPDPTHVKLLLQRSPLP
jgi:hypothetical protein